MCINPRLLNSGVSVPCRKCWQCRANRINDWVGRCIAESQTARACTTVTLTYGPDEHGEADHARAAVLTYSDVQKYFKRLRRAGFPLRYFVVGEFGSAKGRAHWHGILFWQGDVPPHEEGRRFNEPHWPHGYSFWEPVNVKTIRYVCKYIQKDMRDAERQRQLAMSKYPPLGAAYFAGLAGRYVQQGIAPRAAVYHFPDVVDEKGETIKFRMSDTTLDNFCLEYLEQWEKTWGGHPPVSELLEDYCDRVVALPPVVTPKAFSPAHSRPWIKPPSGSYEFSPAHNTWVSEHEGKRLFWSFDSEGKRAWQNVIRTETQADLMRAASEERSASWTYREKSRGR